MGQLDGKVALITGGARGQGRAHAVRMAGLRPLYQMTVYSISKHGVIGIMRNLAAELAPHRVRVNVICPGVVDTPVVMNDLILSMFSGRATGGTREEAAFAGESMALLPQPWLEARDIANAALWLSSDEARYVTGIVLPVDLGQDNQPAGIPPIAHHALAAHLATNTPASNT